MTTSKKKTTKKKVAKKVAKKTTRKAEPQKEETHVVGGMDTAPIEPPAAPVDPMQEAANQALMKSPEFVKFEIAKRVARTLAESNLVPDAYRGRPNDCFIAINMGAEMGMEPFQAIQSIAVIDGKPSVYGDALIGLVRGSGKVAYIKEWLSDDGKTAYCETLRKGEQEPVTSQYSMQDAVLAGIDTKFNWKKHPKRMLQMRARAYCLRDAYADVLKGLASAEEMYDHEMTPPVVTDYQLPEPPKDPMLDKAKEVFGDGVEKTYEGEDPDAWLKRVKDAMYAADSMSELIKAGEMAKGLPDPQRGVAKIEFKKMRRALMDEEGRGHGS